MVSDADAHATEDKDRREKAEARNRLDSLIYQTEKNLDDWKEAIDDAARKNVEETLERGRSALKQDDSREIRAAAEAIQQAVQAAAQQIYAKAGMGEGGRGPTASEEAAGPQDAAEGQSDEEVVEADYEIVEEPDTN